MTFITLPYTLKFIIAPIIERTHIPFLYNWLGKRRSWLFCSQLAIMLFLCLMGLANPETQIQKLIFFGVCVAVFSALQDITMKHTVLNPCHDALLVMALVLHSVGYRIGTLVSGALALYIAHYSNWTLSYFCMSGAMLIGIVTTLSSPEPNTQSNDNDCSKQSSSNDNGNNVADSNNNGEQSWTSDLYSYAYNISFSLQTSISDIFSIRRLWMVLLFIFCLKIGDTVLHSISGVFLRELGFSKAQIASVDKTFGFSTMLFGSAIGV